MSQMSVRLSNAWIVTKQKKLVLTFLIYYSTLKTVYSSFLTRRMVGGGWRPLLPEILGQTDPVEAKTPIFSLYSLVAPEP